MHSTTLQTTTLNGCIQASNNYKYNWHENLQPSFRTNVQIFVYISVSHVRLLIELIPGLKSTLKYSFRNGYPLQIDSGTNRVRTKPIFVDELSQDRCVVNTYKYSDNLNNHMHGTLSAKYANSFETRDCTFGSSVKYLNAKGEKESLTSGRKIVLELREFIRFPDSLRARVTTLRNSFGMWQRRRRWMSRVP